MKKTFFTTLVILCVCFLTVKAQDTIYNKKMYSFSEMKTNWINFSADEGWKILNARMKNRGYVLIDTAKTMWGAEGVVINPLTKAKEKVVFCVYDYYNKSEKMLASIIWVKNGTSVYKASIEFPKGEMNIDSAYEHSLEYYTDANNKLQLAHSFGRCFRKWARRWCPYQCTAGSALMCGIIAATTGVGILTPGIFLSCVAAVCTECYFEAAIRCR